MSTLLDTAPQTAGAAIDDEPPHHKPTQRHHRSHTSDILKKAAAWLEGERLKRKIRREKRGVESDVSGDESLNALEALLLTRPTRTHSNSHSRSRRSSHRRSLLPAPSAASDTEYASDGDALVPGCEVWLKNPEEIGWDAFKLEVLKLTHTLRCKGWRRVDLSRSAELGIERMSGALTNAVYMVTPPEVPSTMASTTTNSSTTTLDTLRKQHKPPPKLLLRIYGPQVAHLIDRETELYILRRLARQRIGPRMIGTFENGRFEEFFTAHTLTKSDIRVPETSRHIAKRLKELHEGIDLEPTERAQGPIVWKNWEKWISRCDGVMSVVDVQRTGKDRVCGAEWGVFKEAVERYRSWLVNRHGGHDEVCNALVFAHNDTQYGNILRLQANERSPLLLPSNEHRQLVVIDFEYASANPPGYEFANHFCEWMADYHDPELPYLMNEHRYPTEQEIRVFLTAYVEHSLVTESGRRAESTKAESRVPPGTFMLDGGMGGDEVRERERERGRDVENEVERLMEETRAWRAASSAMWAAWGIVQAKLPEVPPEVTASPVGEVGEAGEEVDEEFDYLAYARERALLFWGDCIALGVYEREEVEELQEGLTGWAKSVEV